MGLFSFSATFTECGGDFSGRVKTKRVDDSIEIDTGDQKYYLPKDLKPGTYSFQSESVTKTSAGKSLLKGFIGLAAAGQRRSNPLAFMDTSSTYQETTVNLQFKDGNIFSGKLKASDFQKFHFELGAVDFGNYKKAHVKRVKDLEAKISQIKNNFSKMSSSEQKEATQIMKQAKDRISFLEKEYSLIEKKSK